MRTIGITGGAGFIGFYLAEFFSQKKNYKIIILDNLIRSNQNKRFLKRIYIQPDFLVIHNQL